jgi:hypothetical protein
MKINTSQVIKKSEAEKIGELYSELNKLDTVKKQKDYLFFNYPTAR